MLQNLIASTKEQSPGKSKMFMQSPKSWLSSGGAKVYAEAFGNLPDPVSLKN